MDSFVDTFSVYLSCFDFDKFVGMPSEHSLEVEAMRLIKENKLWAGLVFLNAEESGDQEKLPEFIRYKIRLDSDKVFNEIIGLINGVIRWTQQDISKTDYRVQGQGEGPALILSTCTSALPTYR